LPPEFLANNSRLSQALDAAGKAPVPSAPPVSPMTQVPLYSMTTTVRPVGGKLQMLSFQVHIASSSANPLPTQQRFMSQAGYVNPAMIANYQPSTSFVLMNANNGWLGQLPFQHTAQQNHQVAGVQQGHMQVGFQNQAPTAQPMNLATSNGQYAVC